MPPGMRLPLRLTLSRYLLVTGIGAIAVMAVPGLVVIGFLLFIVPGLVLSAMPVAFVYGCAFAACRYGIRSRVTSPRRLNILALSAAIGLGVLLAGIAQLEARLRLHRFNLEAVTPAERIVLRGHIRLNTAMSGFRCDNACLALLQRQGVKSVSVGDPQMRLVRSEGQEQTFVSDGAADDFESLRNGKTEPDVTTYRLKDSADCQNSWGHPKHIGEDCLIKGFGPAKYDFIIKVGEWREWPHSSASGYWSLRHPVIASFAEIRSPKKLLARAWLAHVDALTMPLAAFPSCGNTYETNMCWARSRLGAKAYPHNPLEPSELLDRWL